MIWQARHPASKRIHHVLSTSWFEVVQCQEWGEQLQSGKGKEQFCSVQMGYCVLRPKCCDKHAQWWWIIQFASLRLPPPLGTQDTWSTCPWRSFRRWGWIALPSADSTTDHRTHQCLDMFRKEKVGDSVFLLETFMKKFMFGHSQLGGLRRHKFWNGFVWRKNPWMEWSWCLVLGKKTVTCNDEESLHLLRWDF